MAYAVYINLYTAMASIIALLSGLVLLKAHTGSPKHITRPLLLLVAGMALWASAEINFLCYIILYGSVPELSVCDALWLAGYLPLLLGLWTLPRLHASQLKQLGSSAGRFSLVIFSTALLLALAAVFYFKAEAKGALTLAQIVDSSYVVLDVLLLILAASTAYVFRPGVLGFAYWLVALGFLVFSVADLLYFAAGTYVFIAADLLYAASYVLIALGLQAQRSLFLGKQ